MRSYKSAIFALAVINFILLFQINTTAQNSGNRGYQVALYRGEALNTTFNKTSEVELRIKSIDRTGNVSASFGVRAGSLIGSGDLTGNIDENGIIRLTGPFTNWQIAIAGRINGDTITANYKLTGYDNQEGRFTVKIADEENNTQTQSNNSQGCKRYEGDIKNTTYNQSGKAILEIRNYDRSGNMTVYFKAYAGLQGEGTLSGKIDSSGVLRLSGPVSDWMMQIAGRFSGDTIIANYTLSSSGTPQGGSFNVRCIESDNSSSNQTQNKGSNNGNNSVNIPGNNQSLKSDSGESINGAWKGTYTCSQGLTNLVLSLYARDGINVDGIFTFLLGDGANMSILGSFKMKGTYNGTTGNIELKGMDWDQKPAGYYLVNLSGRVTQPGQNMSGNVTGPAGCTTFQVEKIKFK